jgi:hypothetical protein
MSLIKPTPEAAANADAPSKDARATFHAQVERLEDAFTVALSKAEERATAAEKELAELRAKHAAVEGLLNDFKAKLNGL